VYELIGWPVSYWASKNTPPNLISWPSAGRKVAFAMPDVTWLPVFWIVAPSPFLKLPWLR
jgi:hypothetical protein